MISKSTLTRSHGVSKISVGAELRLQNLYRCPNIIHNTRWANTQTQILYYTHTKYNIKMSQYNTRWENRQTQIYKYKLQNFSWREAETSVKASQYNFRWTKLTTCDPERFYKLRPLKDKTQFKG